MFCQVTNEGMINENTLSTWWDIFKAPDQLTEVRILSDNGNYSGYFRDKATLISEIKRCQSFGGIYACINEINPDCYGRTQYNKIIKHPKATTNDNDIVHRRILFIDFDPKRPSDTNATDAQLKLAEDRMRETCKHLKSVGFPDPIVACSANGYHLYFRIDLPNDEPTKKLLTRFFKSLDTSFGGNGVDIDNTVYNAARIAKIIGAVSTKGADTPERPQRESKFVFIPKEQHLVPVELIEAVADEYPEPEKPVYSGPSNGDKFDVDGFIEKHGIQVVKRSRFNGGEKIILKECPFDPNHKDSAIFVFDGGGYAFKCFHSSCSSYGWKEFVTHFEPDYYANRQQNQSRHQRQGGQSFVPPEPIAEDGRGKKWLDPTDISYVDPKELVFIKTGLALASQRC